MAKTILIADDSESIRHIFKITLQFKGYEITEAEDGREAYNILKEKEFDLLISDIAMPNMTGTELLNKVRNELKNDKMPIIICTAEKDANEEDFMKKGANKVLQKPVTPHTLLANVENLI